MSNGLTWKTDWDKVVEWDRKYYMHVDSADSEYETIPIESTEGDYLVLPDGTRLLDTFNQLYCVNAGQRVPKIQEAIKAAADRYGFVWEAFTTDYRSYASKLLVEDILGPYNWAGKVSFCNSGSEANERALIFAKLFKNRSNIITREHAYHGWTMGAAGATRMVGIRSNLAGTTPGEFRQVPAHPFGGYHIAPAPHCYDCTLGQTYPECKQPNGQLACVKATERLIKTLGPESVAAMITEPIMGAATIHPPEEYLPQIRKMTKELDILWIADEVLTGFGRTGTWFAHQAHDITPDIMTMAKGIVSSALPAAAVAVTKEIADFMDQWRWWTVATFAAHPLSLAAVCANLEYMIENNIPEMSRKAGEYFGSKLHELETKHPCVGLVKGGGMLWQVEMVKCKETKERFCAPDRWTRYCGDLTMDPNKFIMAKAIEKGVLIGGFTPNTLRIGMSLTVSKEDMDKAIDALDYALTALDERCTVSA